MVDTFIPALSSNVGSATNLATASGPLVPGQPVPNQPPAWTRQGNETPVVPQAIPAAQANVGMPATPATTGFFQPPAWTRETPVAPLPMNPPAMNPQAVSIDMGAPQTPGTGVPLAGAVGDVSIPVDPYGQIQSMLTGYFGPYMNERNRSEFETLIADRTNTLHGMGHGIERIEENVAKANRFDWLSAAAEGAVKGLPFAGASAAIDTVPMLTAFAGSSPAGQGFVAGAESAVVDNAGTTLLNRGTQNTRWLKPGMAALEDVVREAVQDRAPSFWRKAGETAASFQAYTARNLIATAAVPTVYAVAGEAAKKVADTAISAGGGPLAGAGAYTAMRKFDQRNGQDGPALFFGQRNWQDLYRQLDSATWGGQLMNGGVRVARFPLDVATDSLKAVRSILEPKELAQTAVLGVGFAGVNAAKSAAVQGVKSAGFSPEVAELAGQVTKTVLSAPVFAAWTTASLGTDQVINAGVERIQNIGRPPHIALELGDPDVAPTSARPSRATGTGSEEEIELRTGLLNSPSSMV